MRNFIYLERCQPEVNMFRFYSLEVTPTLFGDWALTRRWGRSGSKGQKLEQWFDQEEEAWEALRQIHQLKTRKGYKIGS